MMPRSNKAYGVKGLKMKIHAIGISYLKCALNILKKIKGSGIYDFY